MQLAFSLAFGLLTAQLALGHGAFYSPVSRNMQSYYKSTNGMDINYTPHWIAGGGESSNRYISIATVSGTISNTHAMQELASSPLQARSGLSDLMASVGMRTTVSSLSL